MKATTLFLSIFLTNYLAATKDLSCYSCFYYEGHHLSDPSCLAKPNSSTAKICMPGNYPEVIDIFYWYNTTMTSTGNRTMNMCSVYSGLLDGKAIVYRGCGFEQLNDTCVTAFLTLSNLSATDVTACFCASEDKCNGQSFDPNTIAKTPPPKRPYNSVLWSLMLITLLFAFASYSMCKLMC